MWQCFDGAHQNSELDSLVHFKCMNSLPLVLLFIFYLLINFLPFYCLKLIVSLVLRVMEKLQVNGTNEAHQKPPTREEPG